MTEPLAKRSTRERLLHVLAAVAVVCATLAHLAYYFPRTVDDLFISLRFAENLASGRGAVYNVGERVEGYSGALWMFLQALGYALRVEGVLWTKLLGLVCLLATQLGLYRVTRDVLGVRPWVAWLPCVVLAANSYAINWSTLGLETPLHLATLVLLPVAVHAYMQQTSTRNRVLAILAIVACGTARPESVLYLAVNAAAPVLAAGSREKAKQAARQLVVGLWPAVAVLLALLLARRAYYGYWVPNTYFVKGSHVTKDFRRLAPLVAQGVGVTEAIAYVGGALSLLILGFKRRSFALPLTVVACTYFVVSVILDWMPSLRHHLPITLLAPVGWALLIDELVGAKKRALQWLALAPAALVLHASAHVAQIDNRYSPDDARDGRWVLSKSMSKWKDTVWAYYRAEPAHVTQMPEYEMGQITQAWAVLESSSAPVSDSWFVGRDIGMVGFYTGVRVYDTAGLFTPSVSHDAQWVDEHTVSDALIQRAMALRPLAGEIYEGWEVALARNTQLLHGYGIRGGSYAQPVAWIANDRPQPSHEEVVRRYEAMVARFPRWFHLHTLYGESVGAAVERRLRIKRDGQP
jgi:hypothetical protein